jgi:hypothetical protein
MQRLPSGFGSDFGSDERDADRKNRLPQKRASGYSTSTVPLSAPGAGIESRARAGSPRPPP